MKVLVYVEGDSDRVAVEMLLRQVRRLPGTSVKVIAANGKGNLLAGVPARAREHLAQNPTDWVFVVPDLHPIERSQPDLKHETASELRTVLRRAFGKVRGIPHFRPHVFVHDLEALVLASRDALSQTLGAALPASVKVHPEQQNHKKPPKAVVQELFRKHGKIYQPTLHAPRIIAALPVSDLATRCPAGFGLFWREIEHVLRTGRLPPSEK